MHAEHVVELGTKQEAYLLKFPYVMVATMALELSLTTYVLSLAETDASRSSTAANATVPFMLDFI